MSKKSKEKSKRREERDKILREERNRSRNKKYAIVAICLAALVLLGFLARNAPTDWDACESMGTDLQHFHVYVYIHLGNASDFSAKYIRLDDNMGVRSGCMYPIHIHEGYGTRGPDYTMVHVESRFSAEQHRYTLVDLFNVWGHWLNALSPGNVSRPDQPIYFGPNRVANHAGPMEVRISTSSDPRTADYTLAAYDAPLRDQTFVHVWMHDPYTDTGSWY